MFKLNTGVRQGGILSPILFAIYIDDIVSNVTASGYGCHIHFVNMGIFLYADDIVLLSPTVYGLQKLLNICELEFKWLDMQLNPKKSVCLRIGVRFKSPCCNILTSSNQVLQWVDSCRYLGIELKAAATFRCEFAQKKKNFYRMFNSVYGRIGNSASAETLVYLLKTKCLPILLYGVEAVPINVTDKKVLELPVNRAFMKIFKTYSTNVVNDCKFHMYFLPVANLVDVRKAKFLLKYSLSDNIICKTVRNESRELQMICEKYDSPTPQVDMTKVWSKAFP